MQTQENQQETKEKITVTNRELRCVIQRIFARNDEAELDLFYDLANAVRGFDDGSYVDMYYELIDAIRETVADFISEKMIYANWTVKKNIGDIIMGIVADYDSLTAIAKIIYIFTKDDTAEVKTNEYAKILKALDSDE
ncbi:MAG: hypothetical protein QXW71_06625 [Thermoplasmata archaeon]